MAHADNHYGLALFCADLHSAPAIISGALGDLAGIWPGEVIEWQGLLSGADRHTRLAKLTSTRDEKLENEINNGLYTHLLIFIGDRKGDRVSLGIELSPPRRASHGRVEFMQSLPDTASVDLATATAQALWSRFDPAYGFAVVRESSVALASELTGFVVNVPGADVSRIEEQRLFTLQDIRARLGEVVRVPAWDTFLGAQLVEQLGGMRNVRQQAPVACTCDLAHGGCQLRLTDVPGVWGSAKWKEDNRRLAKYLSPVLPAELYPAERSRQ